MKNGFWRKLHKTLFKLFFMSLANRRYCGTPAVFEAIYSADPKKLFLIVLAFNEPELIELHHAAITKFLHDEYEYFIMDNSSREDPSAKIRRYCLDHRINYIRLPKNPGLDESINPGLAFNWIYRNLIERFLPDRFGFIDSDLFPTEPVSLHPYLDESDAWGIITERRPWLSTKPAWYLWLGLLFFRRERFTRQAPNFLPDWGLDAGGRVRVDPSAILRLPDVHDLHREYRWEDVAPGVRIIRYGKFIHFTGASWQSNGVEGQKRWFRELLKSDDSASRRSDPPPSPEARPL